MASKNSYLARIIKAARNGRKCDSCGERLDPEKGEVFLTDAGGEYCNDCYPGEDSGVDDNERSNGPHQKKFHKNR